MDISYLLQLQNFREATGGIFNGFFQFLTDMGWSVIPFLIVALIYWSMDKKAGIYLMANMSVSAWLNAIIKLSACIYRPWIRSAELKPLESARATATGYSFPSGHMANATALYGGLAVWERKHRALRNWLIALVLLIGFSRNYVGVHTPQDIVVSCFIGILLLFGTAKLLFWADGGEKRDLICLIACSVLCLAAVLYFTFKQYPLNYVDGKLLVDPAKMRLDGYSNCGVFFGFTAGWFLERRYVRFSTKEGRTVRLGRFVPGGIILLFLFQCLGSILALILPPAVASVLNRVILMLYITWIYPVIFTVTEKQSGGRKKQ